MSKGRMPPLRRTSRNRLLLGLSVATAILAAGVAVVLTTSEPGAAGLDAAARGANLRPSGAPQLIGIEKLPEMEGAMCQQWEPASASALELLQSATAEEQHVSADWGTVPPGNADREPSRVIRDTYPTYSAIKTIHARKDMCTSPLI